MESSAADKARRRREKLLARGADRLKGIVASEARGGGGDEAGGGSCAEALPPPAVPAAAAAAAAEEEEVAADAKEAVVEPVPERAPPTQPRRRRDAAGKSTAEARDERKAAKGVGVLDSALAATRRWRVLGAVVLALLLIALRVLGWAGDSPATAPAVVFVLADSAAIAGACAVVAARRVVAGAAAGTGFEGLADVVDVSAKLGRAFADDGSVFLVFVLLGFMFAAPPTLT